jgi:hypothetical protein
MSMKSSIDSMTDGFHMALFRDFGLSSTVDGTVTDDSGSKTGRRVIVAAIFHSEWTRIVQLQCIDHIKPSKCNSWKAHDPIASPLRFCNSQHFSC